MQPANQKATIILLQVAPMGFNNAGWKFYLLIICWSAVFIPGKNIIGVYSKSLLTHPTVIYFFFPETAQLTLEEIAKQFGEEVAVHLTGATDEEKAQIARGSPTRPESSVLTESTRDPEITGAAQHSSSLSGEKARPGDPMGR